VQVGTDLGAVGSVPTALKGCAVLENLDLPKCKITEVDLRECPRLVEAVNDERTFTEESKILKDKDTGRM